MIFFNLFLQGPSSPSLLENSDTAGICVYGLIQFNDPEESPYPGGERCVAFYRVENPCIPLSSQNSLFQFLCTHQGKPPALLVENSQGTGTDDE